MKLIDSAAANRIDLMYRLFGPPKKQATNQRRRIMKKPTITIGIDGIVSDPTEQDLLINGPSRLARIGAWYRNLSDIGQFAVCMCVGLSIVAVGVALFAIYIKH
jgi:hypothetical protein